MWQGILNNAYTQNFDNSEFFSYGDDYFFEAIALPGKQQLNGTQTTQSQIKKERLLITFRLTYDLLTFKKTMMPDKSYLYVATPSLFVEALNYEGVIGDRATWRDTVRVREYEKTNSKKFLICGSLELSLRPESYKLKYTIDDGTPELAFTRLSDFVKVPDFHGTEKIAIGTPKFFSEYKNDTLLATEIDGATNFGKKLRVFTNVYSEQEPTSITYTLLKPSTNPEAMAKEIKVMEAKIIKGRTLSKPIIFGNNINFTFDESTEKSGNVNVYGAWLEAPIEQLDMGDYILRVTVRTSNSLKNDSILFKLRWVDMPLSFAAVRNDYSIRVLYPIATPDEIKEMRSGSKEEKEKKIIEFWKKHDPTPNTKYNEAMAEYYARVDYAFFNFKSIDQNDGAFSDRGKIYILNGAPTDIQRDLRSESPREVWIYKNRVAQTFIFTDKTKKGNYKLVEVKPL